MGIIVIAVRLVMKATVAAGWVGVLVIEQYIIGPSIPATATTITANMGVTTTAPPLIVGVLMAIRMAKPGVLVTIAMFAMPLLTATVLLDMPMVAPITIIANMGVIKAVQPRIADVPMAMLTVKRGVLVTTDIPVPIAPTDTTHPPRWPTAVQTTTIANMDVIKPMAGMRIADAPMAMLTVKTGVVETTGIPVLIVPTVTTHHPPIRLEIPTTITANTGATTVEQKPIVDVRGDILLGKRGVPVTTDILVPIQHTATVRRPSHQVTPTIITANMGVIKTAQLLIVDVPTVMRTDKIGVVETTDIPAL